MSKQANPALIGVFVVGAIVCAIVGIMLFGGGTLFERKFECIVFFDESISGLDVGAPVDFQGVRIGTVTGIWLEFCAEEHGAFTRPVVFQLEGHRISSALDHPMRYDFDKTLEALVAQGLRARLATQSILTGKLKIELGIFPHTAVQRHGHHLDYWEMPSIPSPFRQVVAEATDIPLGDIMHEVHRSMRHMADMLDPQSPLREEWAELIEEWQRTGRSLRLFLDYMEQHPESLIRGKREP